MDSKTTIQINRQTRELLGQIGMKGQTYDEVIMELVKARSKVKDLERKVKNIEGRLEDMEAMKQ